MTDHSPVGAIKRLSDPSELRRRIRAGRWTHHTSGQAPGYAQANLVVVPLSVAFDFLLFAQRNPKPCPVLEVLDPGDPVPHLTAPDADIRTDLPGYRVYREGKLVEERTDIADLWGPRRSCLPHRLQLHLRRSSGEGRRSRPTRGDRPQCRGAYARHG